MRKVYAYHLPYGDIYLYGENLELCIPILDSTVDSVEDICAYCSTHNLRICHNGNFSVGGLLERFIVKRIIKRYSVNGSWKEIEALINEN